MRAEIISIGDEIISGQHLDTNSAWLSQRLEEFGVRVLYHSTTADEMEPCIDVFRRAIERADIVIATGGLGPTADDLTREALARTTDRELVLFPEALEHIRNLFARRKWEMPRQNEVQAYVSRRQPDDSESARHSSGDRSGSTSDGQNSRADFSPCPAYRPR